MDLLELADRVERLGRRTHSHQEPIASILRSNEPGGLTGYDWDAREAFGQAIELVKLAPHIAAALRARASQTTADDGDER